MQDDDYEYKRDRESLEVGTLQVPRRPPAGRVSSGG